METKRIALACFIGGVLCALVALVFAPVYWWLGLIAGMAGGYISYEFREVRKAIPIALRVAGRESVRVKMWLLQPRPFLYSGLIVSILLMSKSTPEDGELVLTVLFTLWLGPMVGVLFSLIADMADMDEQGNNGKLEMPYSDALRLMPIGLSILCSVFIGMLWRVLVFAMWETPCFLGRFALHLFKLIHSDKRVLCAIDGTLGGVVSYIWLAPATSLAEQVVVVFFGGLLGAAFGVLNWEIVSKRILHVSTSTS